MTDNVWTKLNTLLLLVIVILLSVMLGRQSRNQSGRFVEPSGGSSSLIFDTQTGEYCFGEAGTGHNKEMAKSLRDNGFFSCSELAKR
jgi:hypothetical protein